MVSHWTLLPIGLGFLFLLYSLVRTRNIFQLLQDNQYRRYWLVMSALMVVFLGSYIAIAWTVVAGYEQLHNLLMSGIFLFGAIFVSLVVHSGYVTITDLRNRERRLDLLYEVTSVLNRVLRHNLRNDMTTILAHVGMLDERLRQQRNNEPADSTNEINAIETKADELLGLADRARNIHELISRDVEHESINVATLVTDTVNQIQSQYPEAEIKVNDCEEHYIRGDPKLQTAVEQLLENAIQHNDGNPTVSVSVSAPENRPETIEIAIADNGPGIPEHEIEVIQNRSETQLKHGSGIGLWLVSWIVRQHDGELAFEESDPTGTVVSVVLPALPSEV